VRLPSVSVRSVRSLPIGAALLAVLIPSGCTVTSDSAGASSNGFVTRSGDMLLLHGNPFRFSGANISWGALDGDARIGFDYPTPFRVQSSLQTVVDMGETVVRCLTCGISTGMPLSVEPEIGDFSQAALRQIDYFVAQAQDYGLKVVIPLTDNYDYYQGSYCDFTNWLGLSSPRDCPSAAAASAFYTSPRAIAAFERYIHVLLTHVNYYTKVPNSDDPTIMAWETGNELPYGLGGAPQFTRWTATISSYIKSIAPSQLVMDGSNTIDPGDLTLPDVDIVDLHSYPVSTSYLNASASQVAAANKAMVVGEYGWNNPSSSNGLAPFLQDIQQTTSIAGDMYWDLFPQNDLFGYVEHFDGFQLHFPGDNMDVADLGDAGAPVAASSADTSEVSLLRSHAYAMAGQPVPAYLVPPAPVITNVEHVASTTAGTGNLVEWRGSPGAAQYLVRRSTSGPGGPWTTVTTVSAAAIAAPYLDSGGGTGPTLWYQVTAINPAGVPGPPSSAFQVTNRTLDDNLDNFSLTVSHSHGVSLDTSNAWQYGGDWSRAAFRPSSQTQAIEWQADGIQDFEAIAYYVYSYTEHFTIQVSANGSTWTWVPPSDVQANQLPGTAPGDKLSYIYTMDDVQGILAGANYVRMIRYGTGSGTAEIGEVRITYP
jgi:mannan endo-1,4-beta-mannosidase